jgi:hypothetical protein
MISIGEIKKKIDRKGVEIDHKEKSNERLLNVLLDSSAVKTSETVRSILKMKPFLICGSTLSVQILQ